MIQLRALADTDLSELRSIDDLAFGVTQSDERWAVASAVLERERQIGAFDGGRLVGHAGVFSQTLTVPGAQTPVAAVTWVMVHPTHRRRGVLRSLMHEQLSSLHESGEAVATLWASEPGIYPRFGYGQASRRLGLTVPRASAALRPGSTDEVSLTIGSVSDLLDRCTTVYEAYRPVVPGLSSRTAEAWAEGSFDDTTPGRDGSVLRCVLATDAQQTPVGYAWYQTKQNWDDGVPGGEVTVHEFVATTPPARRALLAFVLDIDLTTSTHLWNLPVDHPLPWMLLDARRASKTLLDGLWVRLVRLDEALAARCYSAEVDVVVQVSDQACPWNEGRWRLAAGPQGAQVCRTAAQPDLQLDVSVLGEAFLGDGTLLSALEAGRVDEATAGAGVALHRAMRGDRAPWAAFIF
jgi:predicted acetyltransferase